MTKSKNTKALIFITEDELRGMVKQLIDLGAKCQKSKSFLIIPSCGPALSAYDWAHQRAMQLFGERKSDAA